MQIIPKYWRKNSSLKNVHVETFEWFDRVNGNSYFANIVTVNLGLKNEFSFNMPFEYGYGNHSLDMACKALRTIKATDLNLYHWSVCQDNKINVKHVKHENCLKREVIAYSS